MQGGRVRDWLVFSDVHILVVAAGWILGNSALFAFRLPESFLALACVGAFLVYRLDRLLLVSPEDTLNAPGRVDFSIRYRWALLAVALVVTLVSAYLALTMQVLWLEVAILVGTLGMIYPLRILPGGRRPKDIAWLKTTLIVACWVGGGVVLPLVLFGGTEEIGFFVVAAAYRTVWILPNLLVADWLDREGDRSSGSGNLVVTWSIGKVRLVLMTSALGVLLLAIAMSAMGVPIALMVFDVGGFVLLAFFSWRVILLSGGQGKVYGGMVWLDLLVAWPILVWLLMRIAG